MSDIRPEVLDRLCTLLHRKLNGHMDPESFEASQWRGRANWSTRSERDEANHLIVEPMERTVAAYRVDQQRDVDSGLDDACWAAVSGIEWPRPDWSVYPPDHAVRRDGDPPPRGFDVA